ncbi:Uncharacterised protein [Yersinia massiliensis]|uniref:EpsG family protein n=1 Tax=Yersinia massiliensis TaxID=419257 RepID=UPI0005DDE225|nr:Uncharacterised protein [Yersinia massiliensis]
MIYILIITFLYAISLLSFCKITRPVRVLILLISVIIICILSGLRWRTGTDWAAYYNLFNLGGTLSDYLDYWHFEVGFKFINWLFYSVFDNYSFFLFFIALFVIGLKVIVVRDYPYAFLCLFSLFCISVPDLFPTRQQIAVSICIYAIFNYSKSEKLFFYSLIIGLASTIHMTAIIMLAAPILLKFRLRTILLISITTMPILAMSFNFIMSEAANIELLNISHQVESYNRDSGYISFLGLTQRVIIFSFILICYFNNSDNYTKFETYTIKMFSFGTLLFIFLSSVNVFYSRIALYFSIFEYIALPLSIYRVLITRKKEHLWTIIGILFLYFSFFSIRFTSQLNNYYDLYIPYETIFDSNFKPVY